MSKHQFDLVVCLKQPGSHLGVLCDKCDGRCPVCDSHILNTQHKRAIHKVKICESCAFGKSGTKCIICGMANAHNTAYYCWECSRQEKSKDGCPKVLNTGSNTVDRHFELKNAKV
ncbi:U2 snRNP complex subunit RDS3 KNAG_0A07440 [Huiozyma naganishii CBS 8797]|uniref:Uncharacterized protein n=1 Tax=Huiozyma naganishii (strain ATCC MYA-139 / BCRC 22969 / CBS 8797 / KCTC 17520 / NBRC 10181 / NCYC 3082 / Yp74L-3) TaxID=1071383 RepID=J7RU95_HUIN7|nr:hypothetical protein KNAG_0A07440 [Kazachstania naganishii CBS 8797]CCK68397.1 hypothetical protein KNAG_0A07440 [Kazachstania naganishii CBS 8797]